MAQDIINPIQNLSYTSKDFETVYPELLDLVKELTYKWDPSQSNESDPGVILLKLMAIFEDKCNYNIDKNILECFPASVTQETNARRLFEQLGYYMRWYRGATVDINLTLKTKQENLRYTVPAFTMVSDADKSIVYTLLGSANSGLLEDEFNVEDREIHEGKTQIFKAIQGVAVDYSVATTNNKLITVANLDSNNRLYFNSIDIAENGIFIHNADENNYSSWKRKDNLLTEELGNTFYKFGVTADGTACYIEFPSDAEQIFKSGIYITYIKTLGKSGNIAATLINTPYADLVTESGITLTADNLKIVNTSSATNGKDKETINEAYDAYKRTIGTFATLVTLRDYTNAIRNSGLVGNAIVTDRTNDIQQTYNIQTLQNGINQAKTMIEPIYVSKKKRDGSIVTDIEEPSLSAFSLKLYLLQKVKANDSVLYFNNSFNPCDKSVEEALIGTSTYDGYLSDTKLISHDFGEIISPTDKYSHLCYFKNKYPLSLKIIPQYNLSQAQKKEVIDAIKKSLYNNLNSQMVEFGSEISLDYLNQVILSADSRIKAAMIDNINYVTYAVYKAEDGTYKEVAINDTDEEEVTANIYRSDSEGELKVQSDLIVTVDHDTFYDKISNDTESDYREIELVKLSDGWSDSEGNKIDIEEYGISFESEQMFQKKDDNSYIIDRNLPQLGQNIEVTEVFIKSKIIAPDKYNVRLNQLTFTDPQSIPDNAAILVRFIEPLAVSDRLRARISYKTQFRNEIYTKSVLAGATQFYIEDETFDYKMNQVAKIDPIITDVKEVRGKVNLSLTGSNTNESDPLTLKSNEAIQFFAPNLLDEKKYSNYVRYVYYTGSDDETTIPKNSDHQLSGNERICFFWRESDDINSEFSYCCYGAPNIIKPSFPMKSNNNLKWVSELELDSLTHVGEGSILNDTRQDDIQDKADVLSGSKSAIRRIVNTVTLPATGDYYIYWVTNNRITVNDVDKYVLFEEGETTRVLSANEYLIYTNDNGDNLAVLGSGTTITREESTTQWSTIAIPAESILNDGASAIENGKEYSYWMQLNTKLTLTENQFVSLTSGTQLFLQCNKTGYNWKATFTSTGVKFTDSATDADLPLTLNDFQIRYKRNTAADTKKEDIAQINIQAGSWNAKSLLNIYVSPSEPLRLLENQSLEYRLKEDTGATPIHVINGAAKTSLEYPEVLLASQIISNSTPEFKSVSTYDDNGNLVYPSFYRFEEQIKAEKSPGVIDDEITYTASGEVQLSIRRGDAAEVSKSLMFALPQGEYILKITNGGTGKFDVSLSDGTTVTPLKDMYNDEEFGSGSYYLHANLSGTKQYTLRVRVTENNQDCSIVIANPYKYVYPTLSNTTIGIIEKLIKLFDTQKIFDFTYVVPENSRIQYPLAAKNFNQSSHIYNKFTICQLDTAELGNNITTV